VKPVVTVAGTVAVPRSLLSQDELEHDRVALSAPNPARLQAEKLGSYGAWRLPERLYAIEDDADHVRYPLGARDVIQARLRGKAFTLDDQRPQFEPEAVPCSTSLRPDQEAMVAALLRYPCGIGVGPCGMGKGEVIVALVARLGLPALVVVGQTDQARELADRFQRRCGIDAGMIGGGRFDVRRITVALVQSLSLGRLETIKASFGALVVDEGHHACSPTYVRTLSMLLVRRRYALTATPRDDGMWPLVLAHVGPVRHEITREDLVEAGASVMASYRAIPTSFVGHYETREHWGSLQETLVTDETRNRLIVDTVFAHCRGELGMVLTGRITHAECLAELAGGRGLRAVALTGATKAKERERILASARAGELDVVCSTQLADEGLDVPRLSRVFLTFPSKAEPRFVQRVGRALRVHPEKASPVVFDFHDIRTGVLRNQARIRAEAFARNFGQLREAA
jgi:superfamily II DNA or RNA helicase